MRHWGKIDILCNNAVRMDEISLIEDVSTELWNRVFAVNVTGTFFVSRAVLPHMRQREKGVIVNTASAAGLRGGPAGGTYVASKPAVVGFSSGIACSHGNAGIRCNASSSEEHTSELQELMRITYARFCLNK